MKNFLDSIPQDGIENEVIIDTPEQFDDFFKSICFSKKIHFFRGQSNIDQNGRYDEWEFNSTSRRSIFSKFFENFDKINENDQIFSHMLKTYDSWVESMIKGDSIDFLSLLAHMQHLGLPTFLIDFTGSFEKSLWFAFNNVPKIDFNELENEIWKSNLANTSYSNIFIIEYDDLSYVKNINSILTSGLTNENIKKILENCESVLGSPIDNSRAISQNSFFVIDNEKMNSKLKKIKINHSLKNLVDKFLKQKLIISEKIFPDSEGVFKQKMLETEEILVANALWFESNGEEDFDFWSMFQSIGKINHLIEKRIKSDAVNLYEAIISRYLRILPILREEIKLFEDDKEKFDDLIFKTIIRVLELSKHIDNNNLKIINQRNILTMIDDNVDVFGLTLISVDAIKTHINENEEFINILDKIKIKIDSNETTEGGVNGI